MKHSRQKWIGYLLFDAAIRPSFVARLRLSPRLGRIFFKKQTSNQLDAQLVIAICGRKITASFKLNLKADGPDYKMIFKFGKHVERFHSIRKQGRRIDNVCIYRVYPKFCVNSKSRCKIQSG